MLLNISAVSYIFVNDHAPLCLYRCISEHSKRSGYDDRRSSWDSTELSDGKLDCE